MSEELQGREIDGLALFRERETAAATLAEPRAEPRFEVGDIHADRRFVFAECDLRGREAAMIRNRHEHPQQAQVDITDLAGEDAV